MAMNINELVQKARAAQHKYAHFTQKQVDKIFKNAALAASMNRIHLARLAVDETRIGLFEDKVIKNQFASEYIHAKYKDEKTCGVIERNTDTGITKVAEPMGVIAGIIPTTNPTSTAIFKSLITLKTRNAIILSPHPRAKECTIAAARTVYDAAVDAGAPKDIISWIDTPAMTNTQQLMTHPDVALILATGGNQMVRSAMSSSHPALGVGAGNTPVVIDETADIPMAVSSIILSKSFDNGVICASEQSVIVSCVVYDKVRVEFQKRGAYFLNERQIELVRPKLLNANGDMNPDIVGKSVAELVAYFGLDDVPSETRILVGEVGVVGKVEPFSHEKLCPILAMYKTASFEEAVDKACAIINFGGSGHTSVLYTSHLNQLRINYFQQQMNTVRILINTPASQGAIGDLYNFHLDPSLTLGCGTWGNNSISHNVTPQDLLNIKTVTERRENMLWFRVPPKIYFKSGCLEVALKEFQGGRKRRAFIVTDKPLYDLGVSEKVTDILDGLNPRVHHHTFYHVKPDPTISTIMEGVRELQVFKPDVIIAIGGGSPMDAAKIMWLMYEQPDVTFGSIAARFMDIRKRIYDLPDLGKKADLVCIPTTSGTGSEVTPFSVVTDDATGFKYPLADYALTPTMAIIDPQLIMSMPPKLTAYGGIDAVTHALESYVSVCATDFTRGLSREALEILFEHLPTSYNTPDSIEGQYARERVHYAATIAGMAFANAFLGICHSLAHKIGAAFHIPHGLANAALISHVIIYNATDAPFKMGTFPQYRYPMAKQQYAEVAKHLNLHVCDEWALVYAVERLKSQVGIPSSIAEIMGEEKKEEYFSKLDEIALQAFDDQCTGANPRYPLVEELKTILKDAWYGPPQPS